MYIHEQSFTFKNIQTHPFDKMTIENQIYVIIKKAAKL